MNETEIRSDRRSQKTVDIEGEFSDYDRMFFQQGDTNHHDILWMFSEKNQTIMYMDLSTKKTEKVDVFGGRKYQQVEIYDKKIFCIDGKSLIIDVFSLSKKLRICHKRTFRFTKKVRLKENFCLTVWSHKESGIIYRCVMGPLEDGRYMNFDLLEEYFDTSGSEEQTIDKVICINIAPGEEKNTSDDIVWALDETNKSFMCYDRETDKFFEYNDFGANDSKEIELLFKSLLRKKGVKRMHFYYPFDFFSQKEKNQLKAIARDAVNQVDLNAFVRDKYKEVLLCTDSGDLVKITPLEDLFLPNRGEIWKAIAIDHIGECKANDITVNIRNGEIYCLCGQKIRVFKDSGMKPQIIPHMRLIEDIEFYNS